MAIRLKSCGVLFPTALVSVALLTRIADAQISTGGLNQQINPFGDAGSTNSNQVQANTYGVDAGVGETDNVNLTPTDRVSQTIAIADTDFTVDQRSRLFDVNAVGNFSYLDYLQNAYGNELLGRFDGIADAAIVPGRVVWVLRDDFGQSALDPYTPVTPNNIEYINYVTTGPDLKLPFGGVNFLDVSARYARAQYQTSPLNSNRLLGSIALGRDVSAGGSISLNANTERVMFSNTVLNTDFERSSVFGRYEVQGARTYFVGELGATVVSQPRESAAVVPEIVTLGTNAAFFEPRPLPFVTTPSGSPGSLSGPLAKLELSRKISASAKVIFRAGRDLTDASSSFSTQATGITGINPITSAALTSDSYRVTYASAGWEYTRNRTTLAVTGRWEQDIYPGLPSLDVTLPGADLRVERRMTRAFTAQLIGSWYKTDYPHAALASQVIGSTEYANNILGAALIWRHGRALEVRLRCDHDTYTASNGNTGYHVTQAFLTVGYRPQPNPPTEDVSER
jgi:hypothetical protein